VAGFGLGFGVLFVGVGLDDEVFLVFVVLLVFFYLLAISVVKREVEVVKHIQVLYLFPTY
jgi:hypothetical protein